MSGGYCSLTQWVQGAGDRAKENLISKLSSWSHFLLHLQLERTTGAVTRSWAITEQDDFPHVVPVCSSIYRQMLHISIQEMQRNQESTFLQALEKTVFGITLSYDTVESATVPKRKQTVIAATVPKGRTKHQTKCLTFHRGKDRYKCKICTYQRSKCTFGLPFIWKHCVKLSNSYTGESCRTWMTFKIAFPHYLLRNL